MDSQVKLVGILQIVYASFGLLTAIVILFIFGGVSTIVGVTAPDDAMIAMPVLGIIGGVLFFILMITSVPGLIGGIGLLNHYSWARIVVIIISILQLPGFPFGTALGAYSLVVLFSQETGELFKEEGQPISPPPPPPINPHNPPE